MKSFRGRKSLGGSTAKTPTRVDDNLFGTDTVEVILAVSEGPCQGIVGGAAGFLIADVPLVDEGTTTPNISNFELRVLKGTTPADSILPNLGGIGSSRSIGLDLRTLNQQVVGAGQTNQIDYIDLRFAIGRLFLTNDKGDEANTTLSLKVEIKARSSSTWTLPFSNEPPPTEEQTAGASNYRPGAQNPGSHVNAAYHETYIQNTTPSAATANPGAMWFDTSKPNWTPSIRTAAGAWVAPSGLSGAPADGGFYVWSWLDLDNNPRAAWYDQSGQARSPADGRMSINDFLLVPSANQDVFAWNGVNWNAIDDQFTAPTPAAPGVLNITGAARSTYPYEVRIPVPRINEPYDIRVTRLSDKESKYYFAQVTWESFQEISRDVYSFPGLALAHLTVKATDTFTSLPEFTQIWDGRIIRVPSNYDPVARTCAGFWDGTFKLAYSNNPAWVAYDLVMNTSYGKNRYFPEVLDPLATYDFGKHCDLHGFTMNEYITDPRSISETVNYIVGTAGGRYVDRGDGYSTILFDADDQPAVAVFSQENIIDGLFTYSFTDITARKNDFRISYVNPLIGWVEDRIRVYDQNSIDVQGANPEEFIAVGCTDSVEAVKRGRLRLATSLTEKTICSFKTNRQGRFLQPFQIVLIADPNAQQVISGRIQSVINDRTLQLRDEVYLEAGIPLTITFTVGDGKGGFQIRSFNLANASGGRTKVLNLATSLDITLPEKAVFSIGTPKAYRITSIEESEDPDNISVSLIEVNRLKWAFVDGLVELDDILKLQTGPLSRYTYPPTDLQVSAVTRADGTVTGVLSWVASPSQSGGYRVYSSFEGKRSDLIGEPGNTTQFEIPNLLAGTYVFTVTTLSLDRTTESAPASIRFVMKATGGFRPVVGPTGLRLVDEPQAPIFRKRDAVFTWDNALEMLFQDFRVDILAPNGTQLRTINKPDLGYTYTLAANQQDNNGNATRYFSLQLRVRDNQGNLSDPSILAVNHPAPVAIVPDLSALSEAAVIQFPKPVEADWQGTLIWMSETKGFDPLTTTPIDVGLQLSTFIKATAGKTYYIRVAPYDSYGKTGLNISPEYELKITILLFDPFAPNIPGVATLTTGTEISPDGTAAAFVGATWTLDTSSSFGKYEVAFAESLPGTAEVDKRYIADVTNTGTWERHGFVPGRLVSVKQRALSKNGFAASGYSPVATVIAALNTAAPANPTNFTVTGGFERAYLAWTPGANRDIDYVEIWALDGTSTASVPPAGAVQLPSVAYGTNYAQDSQIGTTGTRTYWLRSVNTSGAKPATYAGPATASSAALAAAQIAAGIVDSTKLAASITAPSVVTTLPAAKTTPFVTLSSDGKLYRWDNATAKYTTAVPAVDVGPGLTSAQIASVAATTVTGQLTDSQINALAATKISGQLTDAQISAIAATKLTGQLVDSQIAAIAAAKLTGQITDAQIAALSAAKLAGQITTTQITDSSISTAKIAAGAVVAGTIAAGAVTTSKLTIGGANLAFNSDFAQGALGWTSSIITATDNGAVISLHGINTTWGPSGLKVLGVTLDRVPSSNNGAFDIQSQTINPSGTAALYSVTAGSVLEFSAYLSTHRCDGYILVAFYDATGANVLQITSNRISNKATSNATPLSGWNATNRALVVATVPNTAVTCTVRFRADSFALAVAQNIPPYLGVSGFMLAPAYSASQTEATPYEPGGMTSIQGSNLITGTVGADRIVANSITTSQITAAGINADRLVANSITAAQIAANTITAAQIGVGALTAGTIAANAITASKLQIASVNLLYNTEFAQRLVTDTSRPLGISWASNGSVVINYNAIRTDFCPAGFNSFALGFTQASANGVADIYAGYVDSASTISRFFPASPNVWYEASAYLSVISGGAGVIYFTFYAADRATIISTVTGNAVTTLLNGIDPKTWEANGGRSKVVAQAPANAAYVAVSYRWQAPATAASTGCYLFVSGPMLAAISSAQATAGEVSPYQEDGVTSISGTSITTASINASAIIANSITAGQIAAGTITATQIAARTITANNLVANSITSNEIAANTITAGQIAAGAISTTQLAAGAITADKLGIGLSTGNLLPQSEFTNGPGTWLLSGSWGVQQDGVSPGIPFIGATGAPNSYNAIAARRINADGSLGTIPVQPGRLYEGSVYAARTGGYQDIEFQFFDANGNLVAAPIATTSVPGDTFGGSTRIFGFATAPSNAVSVYFNLRFLPDGQSRFGWFARPYFGYAQPNQILPSVWSASSSTVIDGGQIATNTLSAAKIIAGSITSDKIAANTITASNIAAGTITGDRIAAGSVGADRIVVGSTTLNSWVSGSDTTRINGGSIAANSITANLLKVGARGVTTVDLSFYIERDGNGALTNVLAWTAGYVNWNDNNGVPQTVAIPASRIGIDGGRWYVYWPQGNAGFGVGKDNWPDILNDSNNVLMASVSGITGLSVFTGGTIIDGTRITTRSIQADQIAANQIQTVHMAANSISGDRIVAGSLAADRITSGTISAGVIYIGFDNCFWMDANPGLMRMKNRGTGVEQISLGYIGYWTGDRNDYGLIIRDPAGNEKLRANSAGVAMDGAIINNASIGTAKIANLAVDNLRIADGAVTQVVAVGSSATSTGIPIALRGSGKVLIQAYFNGNSASGSEAGPGQFIITRDGAQNALAIVNAAFALFKPGSGNTQYYPAAMAIAAIDTPGAGSFTYRCQHTNGQGIGGLLLVVTELSK